MGDQRITLKRKTGLSGWHALTWRAAILIGLLVLMVVFHWMERDGLKDLHDGEVTFLDAIYFTMISATTTGYGDIVPVTNQTRMFDALVVTPIRILFLLIFVGSAYMFVARRTWENFLMRRIQSGLNDHVIVTGYGIKNSRAVSELIELGEDPANIVVIDNRQDRLDLAKDLGCTVLRADATDDETLKSVRIERARLIIISAGRDDASILICLTARHLAPDIRISIAVNSQNNDVKARRAGADIVVNPMDFAGLLLATSRGGQHIAEYLADLASIGGRVRLIERNIRDDEIGKALKDLTDELGLRIIRDGKPYGFWRPQVQKLQAGDIIMAVIPTV